MCSSHLTGTSRARKDSPVNGNLGIGDDTGKTTSSAQLSGDTINGNVVTIGTPNVTNGTVTGTISNSAPNGGPTGTLASDITALENLSTSLGGESGNNVAFNGGATINATSGKLDASGNYVFTITSWNLSQSTPLIIHGDGTHNVVFNFAPGVMPKLNGSITLTGGLTANQVLYNYTGTGVIGGAGNGATINGTFLAPNAGFNVDNVVLDGHAFGGAAGQNFQWVSGAKAFAPPVESIAIDKQVSINGGSTWQDVGTALNDPSTLTGSNVEYRVLVSNGSSSGLVVNGASVSDAGAVAPPFTFNTSATITLAAGATVTSDIVTVTAVTGSDIRDTATVSGTVTAGGQTQTLSAADTADYTGLTGVIAIDKQVSVNGGGARLAEDVEVPQALRTVYFIERMRRPPAAAIMSGKRAEL